MSGNYSGVILKLNIAISVVLAVALLIRFVRPGYKPPAEPFQSARLTERMTPTDKQDRKLEGSVRKRREEVQKAETGRYDALHAMSDIERVGSIGTTQSLVDSTSNGYTTLRNDPSFQKRKLTVGALRVIDMSTSYASA